MKKLNQSAFTIVEGLLIFIILAIIGGTAYYVHSSTKNKFVPQATNTIQTTTSKTTTIASPNIKDGFLQIPEYGIKIPLNSDIKDINYVVNKKNSAINFSTASLVKASSDCAASSGYNPLGFYSLMKTKSKNPGLADSQDGDLLVYVNNWYIYYHGPQTSCGSPDKTRKLLTNATISLKQAVQNSEKL